MASYRTSSGERETRSLGTAEYDEALAVCADLVSLWVVRGTPGEEAVAGRATDRARALFYGGPGGDAPVKVPAEAEGWERIMERIAHGEVLDLGDRATVARALAAEAAGAVELAQIRMDLARARGELERERAALQALRGSMLARAAEAAGACPVMADALGRYREHLAATVSRAEAAYLASIAASFAVALPAEAATPAHVSPAHVSAWLDAETRRPMANGQWPMTNGKLSAKSRGGKPATSRAKRRRRVGRFLNWAARTWGFPSPMGSVPGPQRGQVARERGEIQWHSLAEVDAALAAIPAALEARRPGSAGILPAHSAVYWRALIGSLAFAGLRLAELIWLRPEDVTADRIRVANVPGHPVKTGEERSVSIHHARLAPLLEAYRAAGLVGSERFFAPLAGGTWLPRTLIGWLGGDPGSGPRVSASPRLRVKRARPGLLPAGMTARSLRRTFGSLLLRSGRRPEEVAAAMGNTPQVVREHYARLLGIEVKVDF